MELITFINFFLIAAVIQGFVFNLVTLFFRKKFDKVILFLNLIVLFISLNNLQRWLIDNGFISDLFLIKHLYVPWYIFIFPMFYAFTTHFLRVEKRVNDFIRPTAIIFLIELIIRLVLISYVYYNVPGRDSFLIDQYTMYEETFNVLYCIFLFINACLLVFTRHDLLKFILAYDDLNWLKWFIRMGSFVILLWVVAVIFNHINGSETAYYPLRLGSSILLYWIGYQGLYKYNVVKDRIVIRKTIDADEALISSGSQNQNESNEDSFFNEKHSDDFKKIKQHVIQNKLYLDPLISLESLAHDFGMSKSYFSKLINSYSNCNFSDFINSLRVEQSKKFLSNNEFENYTIVSIGLECGFNSKSTFYSAFKKFTSETPSSYRDKF